MTSLWVLLSVLAVQLFKTTATAPETCGCLGIGMVDIGRIGSVTHYQCKDYYTMDSRERKQLCNPNMNKNISCSETSCGTIAVLHHELKGSMQTSRRSVLTYECYPDFGGIAVTVVRGCLSNNTWSDEFLICDVASCLDGYFRCGDNSCIPEQWLCDNHVDCPDGSDEDCGCQLPGVSETFECTGGACIPDVWVCDGVNDCSDGSDELDCSDCPAIDPDRTFFCDNGECVPIEWQCDGMNDCFDLSDEDTCTRPTCGIGEFKCPHGTSCIPSYWKCDNYDDCGDRSDEIACDPSGCSVGSFMCPGGTCLPGTWKCDDYEDCYSGIDELGCDYTKPYAFHRGSSWQSVAKPHRRWSVERPDSDALQMRSFAMVTNVSVCLRDVTFEEIVKMTQMKLDVTFGAKLEACIYVNEMFVASRACIYVNEMFVVASRACIYVNEKFVVASRACIYVNEMFVVASTACITSMRSCYDDEFQCWTDTCIPMSWVCDHVNDCGDFSDELFCEPCNFLPRFGKCIGVHPSWLNWVEAQTLCEMEGGHLAVVDSKEKNEAITMLLAITSDQCRYSIGGVEAASGWRWVTGSYISYSNWENGQPDNGNGSEHCLTMDSGDQFRWHDDCCDCSHECFICEN
ncbi:hypothetical protein ScPMuIL_017297 [Solemya velum]